MLLVNILDVAKFLTLDGVKNLRCVSKTHNESLALFLKFALQNLDEEYIRNIIRKMDFMNNSQMDFILSNYMPTYNENQSIWLRNLSLLQYSIEEQTEILQRHEYDFASDCVIGYFKICKIRDVNRILDRRIHLRFTTLKHITRKLLDVTQEYPEQSHMIYKCVEKSLDVCYHFMQKTNALQFSLESLCALPSYHKLVLTYCHTVDQIENILVLITGEKFETIETRVFDQIQKNTEIPVHSGFNKYLRRISVPFNILKRLAFLVPCLSDVDPVILDILRDDKNIIKDYLRRGNEHLTCTRCFKTLQTCANYDKYHSKIVDVSASCYCKQSNQLVVELIGNHNDPYKLVSKLLENEAFKYPALRRDCLLKLYVISENKTNFIIDLLSCNEISASRETMIQNKDDALVLPYSMVYPNYSKLLIGNDISDHFLRNTIFLPLIPNDTLQYILHCSPDLSYPSRTIALHTLFGRQEICNVGIAVDVLNNLDGYQTPINFDDILFNGFRYKYFQTIALRINPQVSARSATSFILRLKYMLMNVNLDVAKYILSNCEKNECDILLEKIYGTGDLVQWFDILPFKHNFDDKFLQFACHDHFYLSTLSSDYVVKNISYEMITDLSTAIYILTMNNEDSRVYWLFGNILACFRLLFEKYDRQKIHKMIDIMAEKTILQQKIFFTICGCILPFEKIKLDDVIPRNATQFVMQTSKCFVKKFYNLYGNKIKGKVKKNNLYKISKLHQCSECDESHDNIMVPNMPNLPRSSQSFI